MDVLVEEVLVVVTTLKQCGIWKFFQCLFIREQPRFLNSLVEYCHPDIEVLILEGQSLNPTMK